MRPILIVVCLAIALQSCEKKSQIVDAPVDTTHSHDSTIVHDTTSHPTDTVASAKYGTIEFDSNYSTTDCGALADARIPEASGLAASHKYPGFFWTHNDSGNPNEIFLVDSMANVRAIVTVTGAVNRDWEDIETGPGPEDGISYIYVGDIGDNTLQHPTSTIYRFPEPDIVLDSVVVSASAGGVTAITFSYKDGPHNAESLLLDPLTRDLYVATKGATSTLYRLAYPQSSDTVTILKPLVTMPFALLTAGDVASDGTKILFKNYGQIYCWQRTGTEALELSLQRTPLQLPYKSEPQGEAVAWSVDAHSYFTTSEDRPGLTAHLWKYVRK